MSTKDEARALENGVTRVNRVKALFAKDEAT